MAEKETSLKTREKLIHVIGRQLAKVLTGFYGQIRFNIQDGTYVNCNLSESLHPESEKEKENG